MASWSADVPAALHSKTQTARFLGVGWNLIVLRVDGDGPDAGDVGHLQHQGHSVFQEDQTNPFLCQCVATGAARNVTPHQNQRFDETISPAVTLTLPLLRRTNSQTLAKKVTRPLHEILLAVSI